MADIGVFSPGPSGKIRGVAALLAIILGTLGIHYFYIGKIKAGVVVLIISVVGGIFLPVIPGIIGVITIIQGILMFVKSSADFEKTYVTTSNEFPIF